MGLTNFPYGISSFGVPVIGNVGPGVGDIFYLVEAKASTDPYFERLQEMGIEDHHIFATLAGGYGALTENRNDLLCVFPGTYTSTATLTWAKDATHLIGLGVNNQRNGRSAGTDDGLVAFRCTTAAVDNIINVTGNFVHIHGVDMMNNASDNGSRCDLLVSGRNILVENSCFRGGNGANQLNHADGGVPVIFASATSGAGHAARFVNCHFGNSSNDARTVGPGAVLFETGSAGFEGFFVEFIDCVFEMRCETNASSNPKLIHLAGNNCIDRYLLFKNCFFYNFWINHVGKMDYAIVDACGTTHDIMLMNCAGAGIDYWCNVTTHCWTNTADATSLGGIGCAVKVSG